MLAESPNSVSFFEVHGAFNETLRAACISPAGIPLWIARFNSTRQEMFSAFRLLVLPVAMQKTLRALSICQNWLAGPLPDQSV